MKLTDQQLQEIIDLCNHGYSNEVIAKKFKVGKSTIGRLLKEKNITKKKEKKYNEKYPIEDIKNDYLYTDLSVHQICKKYHTHYNTLLNILGDLYGTVDKQTLKEPKNKSITKELIQDCVNKKMTYAEMTKILGIKEQCIRKWIKRFNIIKPYTENLPQKENYIKLNKENLIEYYINRNLKKEDLPSIFGYSLSTITREIAKHSIKKPANLKNINRENTCEIKYGVTHVSKNKAIFNKIKETNLKKYGNSCTLQAKSIKEKALNTLRKKYNNPYLTNVSQSNIPTDILNIIHNKENLKKYIIENNIASPTELSKRLNINESGCQRIIHNFNLDYLKTFNQSTPEKYIREYIQQYFTTECNTRKYLNGYEIDIYIPEKKIGIEFNGNWWHSEYKINKKYHTNKSKNALEKGIFLYHIFEYEWNSKQEQIINQLNNLLGLNTKKIYARKCIIREVSTQEKNIFLEKNHLQGQDKSTIKLGLFYENELVSVMTFVKSRFDNKYEWELSRFCSDANTSVIGGASKLFSYFVKTYKPTSIISYSNNAHTKGLIYQTLNFQFIKNTAPNYVWCSNKDVLSRYQCQKHKLLQKGLKGKSEIEIMHSQKYYRIFDCGNKVWVWTKSNK